MIMKKPEKRTEPRICTAFTARCVELPAMKNVFYTAIKNISPGGMQILCDEHLPVGVDINIMINMIHESAEARAKVAWLDKIPGTDRYCIGLKFMDLTGKNKEKLDDFIDTIFIDTIYYSCF